MARIWIMILECGIDDDDDDDGLDVPDFLIFVIF